MPVSPPGAKQGGETATLVGAAELGALEEGRDGEHAHDEAGLHPGAAGGVEKVAIEAREVEEGKPVVGGAEEEAQVCDDLPRAGVALRLGDGEGGRVGAAGR